MKTRLQFLVGLVCFCTAGWNIRASDPYLEIANSLAATVKDGTVAVGVGNFLYEDTELMSPFSSLTRQEIERALPKTGKFRVVARERLSELRMKAVSRWPACWNQARQPVVCSKFPKSKLSCEAGFTISTQT